LLQIIFYLIFSDVVTLNGGIAPVLNLARSFYHGSFDVVNVSFWFIMSLFLGQIALKGFLEIKHFKKPLNFIFLIAFASMFVILNMIKIQFYWTEHIPTFFTYLFLGYSFKKLSIRYFNGTSFFYSKIMILFPILFLVTWLTLKKLNFEIDFDLAGLHFNYHYLLILSLFGVFSVIYICRHIEKIPILSSILVYCSKASFFILAYHIFIKDVYSVLFDLKSYNPMFHTFLVILNIVLCCLIYMLVKRVPFVRILFYPKKVIALNDVEINTINYLKAEFQQY
jgi:fucose 4-O-acetylase-like acetyltransferase